MIYMLYKSMECRSKCVARCDSLNACAAKYTRRLQKILVKVGEEVVREDKRVCVVASANKMNFKWRLDMITNTHTVTLQDVAFGKFETVKLWDSHTNPPAASNVRGQTPLRKLEVGYDMFFKQFSQSIILYLSRLQSFCLFLAFSLLSMGRWFLRLPQFLLDTHQP